MRLADSGLDLPGERLCLLGRQHAFLDELRAIELAHTRVRLDARDRSRRELEIVRFHTRGRQVVDRVTRAGDALGGVCEGIEGGHERRFAARAARPATGRD